MKRVRQKEALDEIEASGENIRIAWRWAVDQRQVDQLDQAINSLGYFYEWRGRVEDGEKAFAAAAARLSAPGASEDLCILAKILMWQALFNCLLGNTNLVGQLIEQSLNLLDSPALIAQDVRSEKVAALLEISQQTANRAEARQWYRQSLILARSLGDQWSMA